MKDKQLGSEEAARLAESRLEALLKLSQMHQASLQEIADYALEQAVALTKSTIGYLAFASEDEKILTMYSWSRTAMAECRTVDQPRSYPIETTGLWGEAVRQRRPIVTNDYPASNPLKKGIPEGHVHLQRHMNVPVFDGLRIVAVAGVGNKTEEYDESDVRQLTLLMDGMWKLIEHRRTEAELLEYRKHLERLVADRTAELASANDEVNQINGQLEQQLIEIKQAEEALRQSELRLRTMGNTALDAVIMVDARGKVVFWNPAAERIFGYAPAEILGQDAHEILVPERYRQIAIDGFEAFSRTGLGRAVGKTLELDALRKDGSEFPIEISVAGMEVQGQWCATAIIRDISPRKQAEHALRDYATALEERTAQLVRLNEELHREAQDRQEAHAALKAKQETLRHWLALHERERRLVAYEIHDGLAQQLAGARMQLESSQFQREQDPAAADRAFTTGMQLLSQGLEETRRLIGGLRPPLLDDYGVAAALEQLIRRDAAPSGTEIVFHCELEDGQRFSPALENAIFRIIQEGLTNARRYSQTQKLQIVLGTDPNSIRIEIQDWGIGFSPEKVPSGRFGLQGIRERARLFGGKVTIQSTLGKGTRIEVDLPISDLATATA